MSENACGSRRQGPDHPALKKVAYLPLDGLAVSGLLADGRTHTRQSEVGHLGPVIVEQNVVALDVLVHHAQSMKKIQPLSRQVVQPTEDDRSVHEGAGRKPQFQREAPLRQNKHYFPTTF